MYVVRYALIMGVPSLNLGVATIFIKGLGVFYACDQNMLTLLPKLFFVKFRI